MNRLIKISGCLSLILILAYPVMAADYDLVINNGRVMDPETMFDAIASTPRRRSSRNSRSYCRRCAKRWTGFIAAGSLQAKAEE